VERAKRDFLFGAGAERDPEGWLDDDDLEPGAGDRRGRRLEVGRRLVAMIEAEDPPEVWATARRLLDLGLDRREVLGQLRLVVRRRVLDVFDPFDDAGLVAALAALPVPGVAELTDAYLTEAAARPGGSIDEVENAVRARYGRAVVVGERENDPFEWRLEVLGDLPMDDGAPLEWLPGNRLVHVASVTDGIVLTHRLTEAEREGDFLVAGFDLAGFRRRPSLRLTCGEPMDVVGAGPRALVTWEGPEGWLAGFGEGALLAVRVASDGTVQVERCSPEPAVDPALVGRVRGVYDAEVHEPWLPVTAEELVLGLLVEDRDTFARPQPPLCDLADAAGLERRGVEVAHDDSVWRQDDCFARGRRLSRRLGDERAGLAERVFDSIFGEAEYRNNTGPQGEEAARLALSDPELGLAALDEAVPVDDPAPNDVAAATTWADLLVGLARSGGETAVARWLAALVAERAGDPLSASAHLEFALKADPDFGPVVDRAAWYASDRGDAATAARLWRRLESPRRGELDEVESALRASARTPGRNEPCWCGSGRKYKTCHLPEPAALALAERVGWLCRKAVSYLERRGGEALDDVTEAAAARAIDPDDVGDIDEALADPIVFDAVLTEGGWFEQFLADRAALLPDDEALLAAAWLQVPRTIYEVEAVRPGERMTVRDLRSAESIDVRERTLSRTARLGHRFCGRAVPDGVGHQFVGAVFPVRVGHEAALLDLCDESDPIALCRWVGDLHRPPTLTTREGEPLVECRCVLDMPDPDKLAEELNRTYEPVEGALDTWSEMHDLGNGDRILRASLTLDRSTRRLTVATHSDARMDRVLAALDDAGWPIDIVEDHRRALRPGELPTPANAAGPARSRPDPETIAHLQDEMERRWLDEPIPALDGATPRQAAADPTRREALARLIDSFPEPDPSSDFFTFRPDQLRDHLGLS